MIKPLTVSTVLEVAVGDGQRGIEIMRTLGDRQPIRYLAIDQFEMGDGEVTLKAFHRTMRSAGIRAQVFPEPVHRGLVRVANTIGPVDLIIIATPTDQWQTPETLSLLTRVTHDQTVVLYQDEDNWERYEYSSPSRKRAA